MTPELILFGDSHTRALAEGAEALGYSTASLAHSADSWRKGQISVSEDGTLSATRRYIRQKITAFEDSAGSPSPLKHGLPVLASLGFDGMLLSMSYRAHRLGSTLADKPRSGQLSQTSARFTRAHAEEVNGPVLDRLAALAANMPVTVVARPLFQSWSLPDAFHAIFLEMAETRGLTVFDPNSAFAEDGRLPEHLAHEDGRHASAAFGKMIIQALQKNGQLAPPRAAAHGKTRSA